MANYNHNIEDWWRHLGTFDRQNASFLIFFSTQEDATDYLKRTDEWWESLTNEQKAKVYEDFFFRGIK
jgi:hypothetical protein